MILVTIGVSFEDDYFKSLWLVDGLISAAEQINVFNSKYSTQIEILGANQMPEVILYKNDLSVLKEAGIHATLNDFIFE